MPVKTETYDPEDDDPDGLYVLLKFTFTEKYPDEAPDMEIEESENIEDDVLDEFQAFMKSQVCLMQVCFSSIMFLRHTFNSDGREHGHGHDLHPRLGRHWMVR